MALNSECIQTLCNLGVAGGVMALGAVGVTVPAGVVEFLTHGGDLAVRLNADDQEKFVKLIKAVKKDVGKQADGWIQHEFKGDTAVAAEIKRCLEAFEEVLPTLAPNLADLVSAHFDGDALVAAYANKLPAYSILKNSPVGQRIFACIIKGSFGLVRSSDAHMAELTSLSFDKVFAELGAAQKDRDAKHDAVMDAIINNTGLPKAVLEPIFDAVEMEYPQSDIAARVEEAVARIKALAQGSVDVGNLGNDVKTLLERANDILAKTADVDAAVNSFQGKYDEAEGMMLQAAFLATQEAGMYAASFRFDEALAAYEKAARFNPDDPWHWFYAGDIRRKRGNLVGALTEYEKGRAVAVRTGDDRDLSVSYDRIGDIKAKQGDTNGALTAYKDGLGIAEKLAASDPTNSEWQRDLSVSYSKIGDIKAKQGDTNGALTAYKDGLGIREKLAASDPTNSEWQRDLIVSHVKLAQVGSDPVAAYQRALDVARSLMDSGRLAPVDHWMVVDLEKRLAAARGK